MAKNEDGRYLFKLWYGLSKDKGSPYRGNIHRDSYQLELVVEHVGLEEAEELIRFYHKSHSESDLVWFLYNYDKLQKELETIKADQEHRAQIRARTREIIEREGGL